MNQKELEAFKNYLTEEELSQNTIQSYLFSVRKFFESYPELNKLNAIAWKESLMQKFSPKTVNLRLRGLVCYAEYKEVFLKIKYVKIHKSIHTENVITREQFHYLLQCLKTDGQEQWCINLMILGRTGARISELLRITKADAVRGYAELYTKGKVRRIYIPSSLTADLTEYMQNMKDTDVLVRSTKNRPIAKRSFDGTLKRFADKYGIPRKVMHAHSFRHLIAVEFLKSTGNITLLADVLGHSGVNTTMIYTRLSSEEQKREIDKAVNW